MKAVVSLTAFAMMVSLGEVQAAQINLICMGSGTTTDGSVSTVLGTNSNGDIATANVMNSETVGFRDQVNIEINDDDTGRIRIPRIMLPTIRGGKDGWFEFRKIKRSDTEIRGYAAITIIDHPKVRLDRMSGVLNINGDIGDFSGQCEAYDPATAKPKF